jgi:hypothetical protein
MTVSFDIPSGFTSHVMRDWRASFRGKRALLLCIAVQLPSALALSLGMWHVLIVGAFCLLMLGLRSRTRQQAGLAALEAGGLPRITVTLDKESITIHSGEHCWARRHASLLLRVTETSEALILSFANSMTAGIPLAALDLPRDWKHALQALHEHGKQATGSALSSSPPGVPGPCAKLPPERSGISLTAKLILLIFTFAGFYLAGPGETPFQFVGGLLGYLAGIVFVMATLSQYAFPTVSGECEVILSDQGIYLHSGSQDAFCDWQACVNLIDDGHQIHLFGDWGSPFVSIPHEFGSEELADFARTRIIDTHGSLPSQDHEDDHHHDH